MKYQVIVINGYEMSMITIGGRKRLQVSFLSDEEIFAQTNYNDVDLEDLNVVWDYLTEAIENNTKNTELKDIVLLTTMLAKLHQIVYI